MITNNWSTKHTAQLDGFSLVTFISILSCALSSQVCYGASAEERAEQQRSDSCGCQCVSDVSHQKHGLLVKQLLLQDLQVPLLLLQLPADVLLSTHTHTERESETHTHTHTHTHTQRHTHTHRERERERHTHTHTQRERERERHTHTHTQRERDTHTHTHTHTHTQLISAFNVT